ncbi:MAG: arsenic efflux protein [Clostridia bacterium]|nr:arsenic efflux protein [Clostridia bacterium]
MLEILKHSILHALEDSAKMLPFLVIAFFLLEFFEARIEEKSASFIKKAGKAGPISAALLGLIPQCGFSVVGSNFYAKRIITLGTLIAVYLSTSDEALLVIATSPEHIPNVLIIMGLKLVIAVIAGYAIDLILRKKPESEECHHTHHHDDSCEDEELIGEEHCCSHTDWKAIIKCTAKRVASVFAFLLAASFLFTLGVELIGEERLQEFMLTNSVFQPLLTALIGLIPNCAPSIILAQMYIEGTLSLGSVIAGLCTSAGAGLLVLFRVNRGFRSNLGIVALLYGISAVFGVLISLIA